MVVEPLMMKAFNRRHSCFWHLDQHSLHQIDSLDSLLHILSRREVEAHLRYFGEYYRIILTIERKPAHHQRKHDDAHAPHITLHIVFLLQNLRSDVIWTSEKLSQCVALFPINDFCATEVDKLNLISFRIRKHNILRFDISETNVVRMEVGDHLQELENNSGDLLLSPSDPILASVIDFAEELSTFEQFHDDVDALLILEVLVDPHNMGVLKVLEQVDFFEEAVDVLVFEQSFLQDLDGPLVAGLLIDAPVDFRCDASSDEVLTSVDVYELTGIEKLRLLSIEPCSL